MLQIIFISLSTLSEIRNFTFFFAELGLKNHFCCSLNQHTAINSLHSTRTASVPTSGVLPTHNQGAGFILIKATLKSRVCACQNQVEKCWCQTIWRRSKTNTENRGQLYFPLKYKLSRRLPESWTWLFGRAKRTLRTNTRCFL